jgi:hypothetical protein
MIGLFRHYIPYGAPFLALDDRLRIKAAGVHDRGDSVSHQEAA